MITLPATETALGAITLMDGELEDGRDLVGIDGEMGLIVIVVEIRLDGIEFPPQLPKASSRNVHQARIWLDARPFRLALPSGSAKSFAGAAGG